MRARRLIGGAIFAALALVACSPQGPTHDKAFYAANAAERASTLARCQADPGRLGGAPDCVDAQAADADAHAAHFYDAPAPAARVAKPGQL